MVSEIQLQTFLKRLDNSEFSPQNVIDMNMDWVSDQPELVEMPDVVRRYSAAHRILAAGVGDADYTTNLSRLVLMSQAGSKTHWHIDMTGTAVCYALIHGKRHSGFCPRQRNCSMSS